MFDMPPMGWVPPMGAAAANAGGAAPWANEMRFAEAKAKTTTEAGAKAETSTAATATAKSASVDGQASDRDFAREIFNLLSRSRDINVEDSSNLSKQKEENQKKEQELVRRERILKERAAMLTRLQYCLEKDSPSSSSSTSASTNSSTAANANNKDIATRLAKLEQELEARRRQLEAMAKDLANRENALRTRIALVEQREAQAAKMQQDKLAACPCLNQKPSVVATVQHPAATARPAQSPAKPCLPGQPCAPPQPSMKVVPQQPVVSTPCTGPKCTAPAPQPCSTCATKCSAAGGKKLKRRRMAAGKSGRKAAKKHHKKVGGKKNKAASKMRFASEKVATTQQQKMSAAMEAAAAAGIDLSAVTNNATTIGACPALCTAYKGCGQCVADANCGWCSSTQKCTPVNEGKSTCDAADYSIMYCREHSCEQHTFCRSCMADPKCGLCASTGKCTRGGVTGPAKGTCNNWSYATGLRFLSFNIYGRDTSNCTARASIIFKMLERANADFVALQEVEDWFLELLAREKWAANYHMSDFGSGHAPGGLLILSKVPLMNVAYYEKTEPGQVEVDQRGRMLVVHPKMGQGNLAIATSTLDWRSAENRAESLTYLFSVLNVTSDVVMMGDFNFDTNAQPETAAIPYDYEDVWQSLRPHHLGYTWDPKANSYAHSSDPTSRPSRIDRVMVKSGFWEARKIQKIGSPEASPHYGLLTQLELFGAYC
jgi:endonuclease/exonuclease/phosphatase family metal-dependent hydrolase